MEAGSADVQGQPGLGEIPCVKITNKQKNHKQLQKKKKSKRGGKEGKRERRRGDWGRRKRETETEKERKRKRGRAGKREPAQLTLSIISGSKSKCFRPGASNYKVTQ